MQHEELHYASPWEFVRFLEVVPMSADLREGEKVWFFPELPECMDIRLLWAIQRRWQPVVPVFHGCPVPTCRKRDMQRSFMALLSYCKPWVLGRKVSTEYLPHASELHGGEQGANVCWQELSSFRKV